MSEKSTAVEKKGFKYYWSKFQALNGSSVFLAMIAAMIIFEILLQITRAGSSGGLIFITPQNLMMIFRQMVYIGIVAFGLTLVMMTGNIDLSVGNMLTFNCCVAASVMMKTNNPALAVLATLCTGAACGLFNGLLVSYVKLNSFITTLGASSIFSALAMIVSAGTVLVIPNDCAIGFRAIGQLRFGSVSILVVWFVVVALILGFVLSRTVFGQQLYAIGANPIAARYSGVRYKRNITIAYMITGLCVGLAALIMMSNALSSNPQAASGAEMEIILCVVLGGCAVQGGKGSVWGTIIGVLFYGILSAGFTSLHMSQYLQWVVMGAIMLFALSLDVLKGKGVKLWKKK